MAVETIARCDCCNEVLPSSALPDVLIVMGLQEDDTLGQHFYGFVCGCAQRIQHAIGLEVNKHDSLHKPPQ